MYTLNDVCIKITDGSHFSPEDEEQGYPMLSVKDMQEDDFDFSACKHIGLKSYKKLIANDCRPLVNDVVVAKDGSYLKTAFPIKENREIAVLSSIAILRPNLAIVLPQYLSYYLKSPSVFRAVSLNYITGTALKRVILAGLKKLPIQLPDIDEQKRRARLLEETHGVITKRKRQLEMLDTLIKARFVEMFGEPEINSLGWPIETLGNLLSVEPQNGLYKPQSDYVQDGTGIPILRIDAFYDGKVTSFSGLKRLNCTESEKVRYLLHENDIVINRVNSIEYLGKCAWIKGMSEPTVFESNMMRFHIDESRIDPCYLTRLLCSTFIYNQILNRAKKAVNQASINQGDVQSFSIIVPPIELQKQFAVFVEQVDKSKVAVQKALEKAQLLFDGLMQEYFAN